MMENIFSLDMDEVSCTLLVVAAMFATTSEADNSAAVDPRSLESEADDFRNALTEDPDTGVVLWPKSQHMMSRRVKDRDRAVYYQDLFMKLLFRYLRHYVGEIRANLLIEHYKEVLGQLKDMREILLDKSLQF